jgi:hypothetical protein
MSVDFSIVPYTEMLRILPYAQVVSADVAILSTDL